LPPAIISGKIAAKEIIKESKIWNIYMMMSQTKSQR